MDYVALIEQKTGKGFPGRGYFSNVNRERVSFKHHGILPNPQDFHTVVQRTTDHLEQACVDYLGMPLRDVDLSALIENATARTLYLDARRLNAAGDYQASLEALSHAVMEGVQNTPLEFSVRPGEPDSAVALELTAYGVDPGAYLTLQELLPQIDLTDFSILWNTRGKGHPGNWTEPKVAFCLDTVLDLILKIQRAPGRPSAVDFQWVFNDVLTAKRDGVIVHIQHRMMLFPQVDPPIFFGELKKGQQIRGTLTPAFRTDEAGGWEEAAAMEGAELFVVSKICSAASTSWLQRSTANLQVPQVILDGEIVCLDKAGRAN